MVNIEGCHLEIVTDDGAFAFTFPTTDKLSEALLILALQSTKKVDFLDDARFNPARFFQAASQDEPITSSSPQA